ncbi:hypothetical protein [Methylomonas koyamae]|uniref:hypothetical protein n=1 Tax=Methylomonas koyamae TaxID=702114 RepID=UPI0028730206|nr:hypothetical protein [Methylomonas koyamae]WNB75703.1 hypothetical protein RI210_20895 [Methylomonas koyamae]
MNLSSVFGGRDSGATFDSITSSVCRVGLVRSDLVNLRSGLTTLRCDGRDLLLPDDGATAFAVMAEAGCVFLLSEYLGVQFLLVKQDAGKGFFGGQKVNWLLYVNFKDSVGWFPGQSHKSLIHALAFIDSLYLLHDVVLE